MAQRYDVAVLGTGNAGRAAASKLAEGGRSVAIVETRDAVGGTCPLRGCVPKKVLVAAAQTMQEIADAGQHGIEVGPPRLDWRRLIERERGYVENNVTSLASSLGSQERVVLYRGPARFVGRNGIAVGDTRLEARAVVIATGSTPRPLPFDGAELLIDNEDILRETELPERVVFVGGGLIAMEFAHVYARAGAKVTVLQRGPRLLKRMDADAVARLRQATEDVGIEVLTDVDVQAVVRDGDGYAVRFRHDGTDGVRRAGRVAHGAGRVPAVEDLDLDAGGIAHDGPAIEVTAHLASRSNGDVYVAGDALAATPQLSPVATHEGEVVAANILDGDRHRPEYMGRPQVVYTVPALAAVGLTQAECDDRHLDAEVVETDMSDWFGASLYGDRHAYAKVLIDRGDRRILGAHLVGKRAEEIVHPFALAIRFGIGADQLAGEHYAFPTFSSDIKSLVS